MKIPTQQITPTKEVGNELNKEQSKFGHKNETEIEMPTMVENTEQAVDLLNDTMRFVDRELEFEIHEVTNRTMVRVLNRETEEIIREIPPEEILDLVGNMLEMVGIIVDKRV